MTVFEGGGAAIPPVVRQSDKEGLTPFMSMTEFRPNGRRTAGCVSRSRRDVPVEAVFAGSTHSPAKNRSTFPEMRFIRTITTLLIVIFGSWSAYVPYKH